MDNQTSQREPDSDIEEPTPPPIGRARRWATRVGKTVQWAVNIGVGVMILVVFTPLGTHLENALTHVDPLTKADYIVVLGGEKQRAVEAARLFNDGWADTVIVSSWQDSADKLSTLVQAYGVPADKIIIDHRSHNTAAHPDNVAALEGVDKTSDTFIILTSVPHTSRARACFQGKGFANLCIRGPGWRYAGGIIPDKPSWFARARDFAFMMRESAAWGWYALTGKFEN